MTGIARGTGWDEYHQAPTVKVEIWSSTTSWFTREYRASELVSIGGSTWNGYTQESGWES
ncbi:hypothetical protein FHT44_005102 [Mycolicibacterium sp. BK634]|uniref:hypothetical protein n=1 Tax=Mycolicibacterium sp. BK634 TaxID=2587099 RepID=UPI0017E6D050|nr:hypothetical protein [Mycolicibacterium sp. BK634]MBB3752590.1 hypothetical protein [Mycolicibacterium sp. BK634]